MRRPLCSTLVLSLLLAAGPSGQTTPLRLVSTAWPPFTSDSGQPRFALDLVEEALKRIGVSAKTTIVEPARFTPALLNEEFDGTAAAWRDAERERVLLYSDPYLENRLVLIGRKGADVSASSLSTLAGKRVAIVGGYAYGDIEGTGPAFVRSKGEEDSLTLLLKGDADYALMDELVVQYLVEQYANEAQAKLQLGSTPLVTRQLYLAIQRSRPDAESIIRRFNTELRGMMTDHSYNKLLHVQWVRADVDGDGIYEYIPASDRAGRNEPTQAYAVHSAAPATEAQPKHFYVGGNIYSQWANVPARYKVDDPQLPDSRRSTGTLFTFVW